MSNQQGKPNPQHPLPFPSVKELKSAIKIQPAVGTPGASGPRPHVDSPFVQDLVATGKPDWKLASPQMKSKYRGFQMILIGIPIAFVASYEIFRRFEGLSVRRLQKGEIGEDGSIDYWDEDKILEVERNSWTYKLFGPDFFQEGLTSRTLGQSISAFPEDDDEE
ncbi:hypothetical protein JA1_001544 [Spathaspora sp. JA1]|nr:hypothetical protein JA1_001544 [Spathaspora sp. JA1]